MWITELARNPSVSNAISGYGSTGVIVLRNIRKLCNRSLKEVEKLKFVQWGAELFLHLLQRQRAAELIWFPTQKEQNSLTSRVSWLTNLELTVCRFCFSEELFLTSTSLFTRHILPVPFPTLCVEYHLLKLKNLSKGEAWASKRTGKEGFVSE